MQTRISGIREGANIVELVTSSTSIELLVGLIPLSKLPMYTIQTPRRHGDRPMYYRAIWADRDYALQRVDKAKWGILQHSSHFKEKGVYSPQHLNWSCHHEDMTFSKRSGACVFITRRYFKSLFILHWGHYFGDQMIFSIVLLRPQGETIMAGHFCSQGLLFSFFLKWFLVTTV